MYSCEFASKSPAAPGEFVPDPALQSPRSFRRSAAQADAGEAADSQRQVSARPPSLQEAVRIAYEEGLAAGRDELPWEEAEALKSAAEALRNAARELAELRSSYLRSQRRGVIALAVCIAGRLVEREIAVDVGTLSNVIERALQLVPEEGPIEVRISARDHETVQRGLAPEIETLATRHGLHLTADSELAQADVQVLVEATLVDARIEQMLCRVRDELLPLVGLDPDTGDHAEQASASVREDCP